MLTLATLWWIAAALSWSGGRPQFIIGAAVLGAVGHWVSWRQRRSPLTYQTVLVIALMVALTLLMRDELVSGITGDRLPVAEYLLAVQALAAFGLRTRGGLYAEYGLSGLVLFLVAERAFEPTFATYLIMFLGLFLTFWAMAFMEDEISAAKVQHWPEGQLSRVWFWLGIVGGGLLLFSALAYTLLPPDHRGREGAQRVGVMPFMGEAPDEGSARPQPVQAQERATAGGGQEQEAPGEQNGGFLDSFLDGPPQSTIVTTDDAEVEQGTVDAKDVVMHVRSKVTSYWRGRVYDNYDGHDWSVTTGGVLGRVDPRNRSYYWQTYFIEASQPGSLFLGYNPVRVVIPEEVTSRGSLVTGSTYSALSQQPELRPQAVRIDRAGSAGGAYSALPSSSERIRNLAREIVGDTSSAFDKVWNIVSYLRQNNTYTPSAPGDLRISSSADDFLFGAAAGNSVDFATATVLLARASGVPARLAVGYLPGKFDPLSGTHKVRRRDAHAWAEVLLARHGWVAFDGTPRPELERFMQGDFGRLPGATFIFQTRVGGSLYHVLSTGTSDAVQEFVDTIRENSQAVVPIAVSIAFATLLWTVILFRSRRSKKKSGDWVYSRLRGEGRSEVMRAYRGLERLLRRLGLEPRKESQSLAEYGRQVAEQVNVIRPEMEWFTKAAWAAAYDPAGPSPETAREADRRLSHLNGMRKELKRAFTFPAG